MEESQGTVGSPVPAASLIPGSPVPAAKLKSGSSGKQPEAAVGIHLNSNLEQPVAAALVSLSSSDKQTAAELNESEELAHARIEDSLEHQVEQKLSAASPGGAEESPGHPLIFIIYHGRYISLSVLSVLCYVAGVGVFLL